MRVRVIKWKTVGDFAKDHANSRIYFNEWFSIVKQAEWDTPSDIKVVNFRSADLLGRGSERVVFDIGGNHYRMICKYQFGPSKVILYVKWIGTHSAYTALCRNNEQYTISSY